MHSRHVVCLAGVLAALLPAVFAAESQVEQKVVGPATAGGIYTLSVTGGHVAYAGMKGTQAYVSVDGVDGPLFDELFGPTGQPFYCPPQASIMASSTGGLNGVSPMMPVILTADGAHYAYAARSGKEYVVIHDGKEVARGPRELLSLNYGPLTLSPTGRQVFWDEMKSEASRGSWRLMMTGKPGPWSGHQTMTPVFTADDAHYAYNAGKIDHYQDQMLVVDGSEVGYAGIKPLYTADGHLLTVRPGAAVVQRDGKAVITGISVDAVVAAPAGSQWGAIVRTKLVNGMGVPVFFLNGKEVSGTEGAQTVKFSNDGKHYAVICQNRETQTVRLVVDGKAGQDFQGIAAELINWTADGSTLIYTATQGGRNFVVVNDQALPVNSLMGHTPIVLSATGNHYGFGTYDGTNRQFTVTVDGKPVLPPEIYPVGDTLVFSADGTQHAFFAGPIGRSEINTLVINGARVPDLGPMYFAKWRQQDLVAPSFVYSPDGRHLVYLARGADAATQGIYLDGKLAFATNRIPYFPTFTPDSQHLFWLQVEFAAGKPPAGIVFVDGREVVRANGTYFSNLAGVFTVDAQGTATYFAADGDVVKRYRIKAGDSNLATMASEFADRQAQAIAEAAAKKLAAEEAATKAQAEKAAAVAKAKADAEAAAAAKAKARQDALEARRKAAADAAAAKAKARADAVKAKNP